MNEVVTLFLCGDVMTGRGIDQILPAPSDPILYESYVSDARDYVQLARDNGASIRWPVSYSYVWGTALKEFRRVKPDFKIINLETTITTSAEWVPKGINYRMHPVNRAVLSAAKIDCCALANNHMLDFGYSGLFETLNSLAEIGVNCAGAGKTSQQAVKPALLTGKGEKRVWVFSYGMASSGIPPDWAATSSRPGVAFLEDFSEHSVRYIREQVVRVKKAGDLVVCSIHWGENWGYDISDSEIHFAHALIDESFVDIIHGHSSHHPKAIELYRGKPIFYGCGDFINDYEGIRSYEEFRSDLGIMYFVKMNRITGMLSGVEMVPTQMRALRVRHASAKDAQWLTETLGRESSRFGVQFQLNANYRLGLRHVGSQAA